MKIAVVYGSEKKGSTYHIARLFLDEIKAEGDSLCEFFLPRDMGSFCTGCSQCFSKGEQSCPHFAQVEPIRQALEDADLIVFTTPVYVLRASGQMKTLLDHFAFQFMIHRPNAKMFSKTALVISTAAGGGNRPAIRDIATSLKFWGVAKIYKFGRSVYAVDWKGVSDQNKRKIQRDVYALSGKIRRKTGHVKPNVITKTLFYFFRFFQRKFRISEYDVAYWQKNGWLDKKRPWR